MLGNFLKFLGVNETMEQQTIASTWKSQYIFSQSHSGNEVLKKTSNLLRLFNSRLYIFKIRHNNIVPSEQ